MEYLVCRHISAQIDLVEWKHFVRALALTYCLSPEYGRLAKNQTSLFHGLFDVCREGQRLLANTMQTPLLREQRDATTRPATSSASCESVLFQCKASVIMYWLRDSRRRDGGRKEENILTSTLGKLSDIYASPK